MNTYTRVHIYYLPTGQEWFYSRYFKTKKQAISHLKDYMTEYMPWNKLNKTFRLEKVVYHTENLDNCFATSLGSN